MLLAIYYFHEKANTQFRIFYNRYTLKALLLSKSAPFSLPTSSPLKKFCGFFLEGRLNLNVMLVMTISLSKAK